MAGGVNYTYAQGDGVEIPRGEQNAPIKVVYDSYTDGGASGTVVYMGDKLPDRAKIMAIYLYSDCADASLTFDIGDGADSDRYVSALDASSVINGFQAISNLGYEIGQSDGDDQIQVTIGGATASGTIKLVVYYTV